VRGFGTFFSSLDLFWGYPYNPPFMGVARIWLFVWAVKMMRGNSGELPLKEGAYC
jgi:hypothetical protein